MKAEKKCAQKQNKKSYSKKKKIGKLMGKTNPRQKMKILYLLVRIAGALNEMSV